jgi:S-(hydroxymethyl)glutathione dehydrogenase/alcohol dehydrogenase
MKAAVLRAIGQPLQIEEVELDRTGPREVRIRTVAAGVCHSDIHPQDGTQEFPLPTVLGHESAGIVEEVGSAVDYVKPGDTVVTCLSVFCGYCEHCLSGNPAICRKVDTRRRPDQPPRIHRNGETMHQFLDLSSFAEQMLVHEHAVVKIREDMPLDKAALLGCGVTTGLGAVFNTAGVEPGTTVAVIGCGGVGLATIQGAVIAGAGRIVAIDRIPSKLEMAKTMGATDLINATEGDPVRQVRDLIRGGVHYSFEAIGLKETTEQAFDMLRRGGVATIIGLIPVGVRVEIDGEQLVYEKKLQGSNMGSNRFRIDLPRYADFYLAGRLKLDELISREIRLEQINDAFEALRQGEVARQIIRFKQ